MKRMKQTNSGMAMLMALVMIAIASSLAVTIWYNNQLSVARLHNLQQAYQAKHFAQGMLLWASDILEADYEQDENDHDSNLDPWLQGVQGMAVEGAVLSGTLVGLNDRFNINNVIINGQQSIDHVAYLRQLLLALELDIKLADKIIDWIDTDQVPQPNGAEDFVYLAKSPAYQTSGQYFKHIEELALLDGLSADDFNRLAPYVSALPVTNQATRMNVNTMAPVMFNALTDLITPEMSLRLYKNGSAQYQTMADFEQDSTIVYAVPEAIKSKIRTLLSTKTLHLQASSLVQMDGSEFVQYALLQRTPVGNARVISRSLSPYLPKPLVN